MKSLKSQIHSIGSTNRITISSVREDVCEFKTDSPEKLHRFWSEVIASQPDHESDKESVVVVIMNTRLMPYAWHRVSLGTVDQCHAHPREIFRPVLLSGAHSFALMHNHPGGDPSPSSADESITRRIQEAANLLQIRFLDHLTSPWVNSHGNLLTSPVGIP